MANRAYLVTNLDGTLTAETYGSGVLAANYAIAPLWFAFFRPDSLRYFELATNEGNVQHVPYLSIPANRAHDNVSALLPVLREQIGEQGREALHVLVEWLDAASDWVVVDPTEIWMMADGDFEEFLRQCVVDMQRGKLDILKDCAQIYDDEPVEVYHWMGYRPASATGGGGNETGRRYDWRIGGL